MLESAIYSNGTDKLTVSVERIDVLLKDSEILNFPRIIELAGDRLVLAYGRGRHTGAESRTAALSSDGGKTWQNAASDSPWADNVQTSGLLGYMRDQTLIYVDVMPEGADFFKDYAPYKRHLGHYHQVMQVEHPRFRTRRFSPGGELMETWSMRLTNLPWPTASYENYGTLIELANGDVLCGFLANVPPVTESSRCRLFIGRSTDGCKTFEYVHAFVPDPDNPDGAWNYSESDLALLPNGDILCIMRTDSSQRRYASMWQARSRDGGLTWSEPVNTGWPSVKPDLCVLSNGVLACSSGRGMYGHPQTTHVMFSLDGTGETWEYPFAFHTGPGCSYSSNIERNGKLYVVYSDSAFIKPVSTYDLPYQSIKWAVLDIKKEKIA